MGRYIEDYWNTKPNALEEGLGTIMTLGLASGPYEDSWMCEITDTHTGIKATSSKSHTSKEKAHGDAWQNLQGNLQDFYEEQKRIERQSSNYTNYNNYKADNSGADAIGGLVAILFKIAGVILIIFLILWVLANVIVPLAVINLALITFIFGKKNWKNRTVLFYSISAFAAVYIMIDFANGWISGQFVRGVPFLNGIVIYLVYLNLISGLTAAYFLIRNYFNRTRPEEVLQTNEFSKRNLIIMGALFAFGGLITSAQIYYRYHVRQGNVYRYQTEYNSSNGNASNTATNGSVSDGQNHAQAQNPVQQPSSNSLPEKQTVTMSAEQLVGTWNGTMGNNNLVLVIEKTENGQVEGYTSSNDRKRSVAGSYSLNSNGTELSLSLREPPDQNGNGTFSISLQFNNGSWNGSGNWTQYLSSENIPVSISAKQNTTEKQLVNSENNPNNLAQPFYIVNIIAVKTETRAKSEVAKLKSKGYDVNYLWIPDYASLSGAKLYTVYIGPQLSQADCEEATDKYTKIFPGAYGLLVSQEKKRVEIKGIGNVVTTYN